MSVFEINSLNVSSMSYKSFWVSSDDVMDDEPDRDESTDDLIGFIIELAPLVPAGPPKLASFDD
jgi:hypothetical protein